LLRELKKEKEAERKNILQTEINELKEKNKILRGSANQKMSEEFGTSQQNTTYQIISDIYPNMPSYIRAALNQNVVKSFSNELIEIKQGKRTLRTYRKGLPIPFMKDVMTFYKKDNNFHMQWVNDIDFQLFFGRDKSNNQHIIQQVLDKKYKYSNSSIQIKDGKIFLLFAVDIPDEKPELDASLSVGVDLGIKTPAHIALSKGLAHQSLGDINDFLKMRLQMQSRRTRLQKAVKTSSGGHGRTKKLKALDTLREYEANYVKTYNHTLAHQIVKFALDHRAKTIKLELLEGFGQEEKNKFFLRNWSYYQLQSFVKYKAEKSGIDVVFIDPYHTSQTCAVCNHYEEGQREKQAEFICKNEKCSTFDKIVNADYNAALNIARSTKFINKKEEGEYHKKHQAKSDNVIDIKEQQP
jgi:putative transposase